MGFVYKLILVLIWLVSYTQEAPQISNPNVWIKSKEASLSGYVYVTFDCKEFLLTVVCYENKCGPRRQTLENFFKSECKPYLENHFKEKSRKK
jgi:hypothetical protein